MNVLFRLVVTGAALAAAVGTAAPAAASVTYDPKTMKGYAAAGDVRKAFKWSEATLNQRAPKLVFNHDFWTDDNYTVTCGKRVFPTSHHREFGRFELRHAVVKDKQRGAPKGYGGKLLGVWITGPSMGISGTSMGPAVGQPCADGEPGTTTAVKLLSTKVGWALSVTSGNDYRQLVIG